LKLYVIDDNFLISIVSLILVNTIPPIHSLRRGRCRRLAQLK
jgi:hypothetical protein